MCAVQAELGEGQVSVVVGGRRGHPATFEGVVEGASLARVTSSSRTGGKHNIVFLLMAAHHVERPTGPVCVYCTVLWKGYPW